MFFGSRLKVRECRWDFVNFMRSIQEVYISIDQFLLPYGRFGNSIYLMQPIFSKILCPVHKEGGILYTLMRLFEPKPSVEFALNLCQLQELGICL